MATNEENPEIRGNYTWSIPTLPMNDKYTICSGYTRQHYNAYVTEPIITLFAQYYNSDPCTVYDVQNAIKKEHFTSPIFQIGSFQWYLEVLVLSVSVYVFGYIRKMIRISHLNPKGVSERFQRREPGTMCTIHLFSHSPTECQFHQCYIHHITRGDLH